MEIGLRFSEVETAIAEYLKSTEMYRYVSDRAYWGWRRVQEVASDRWNFLDMKNHRPLSLEGFRYAFDFSCGLAVVDSRDSNDDFGSFYHINTSGEPVYSERWHSAGDMCRDENGIMSAGIIHAGKKFRINAKGEIIPGTEKPWPT